MTRREEAYAGLGFSQTGRGPPRPPPLFPPPWESGLSPHPKPSSDHLLGARGLCFCLCKMMAPSLASGTLSVAPRFMRGPLGTAPRQ